MEENRGKVYDYTSMQGQIRVHRVLLLVVTTVIAIGAIYFRNICLVVQEHQQLIIKLVDCVYDQQQEILRLTQEISDLIQNVYNAGGR